MKKWALASSAVAPIAMIGGWSLAGLRQPAGYSPIGQSISALAAHGATDRWIMTAGLALVGGCHLVTAVGLPEVGVPGRALLATGGAATLAVAALPQPASGHIVAAGIAFVSLALWPLPARIPGRRAGLAVSALMSAMVGWLGVALVAGHLLGLSERILAGAESAWPLAVALLLVRRGGRMPDR